MRFSRRQFFIVATLILLPCLLFAALVERLSWLPRALPVTGKMDNLAWSADGRLLATSSATGIRLWNVKLRRKIQEFSRTASEPLYKIDSGKFSLSPDG